MKSRILDFVNEHKNAYLSGVMLPGNKMSYFLNEKDVSAPELFRELAEYLGKTTQEMRKLYEVILYPNILELIER